MYITTADNSISIYFDCTTRETHESQLLVTEHPVETGPNITENARRQLDKFSSQIFVSNAPIVILSSKSQYQYGGKQTQTALMPPKIQKDIPINPLGAAVALASMGVAAIGGALFGQPKPAQLNALTWSKPFDQVADVLNLLTWFQDYAKVLTVHSSKRSYSNVLLEKVRMNRTNVEGTGAQFDLDFKQLRVVSLVYTDAPIPTEPRGQTVTAKGSKSTSKTPPAIKSLAAYNGDKYAPGVLNALGIPAGQ